MKRSFAQRLAELKRRLRPPRILKVTKSGRTYLLITLGVGLGALNTGNNLLYLVLGVMLSLVVVSGVLSERVLWAIDVRRLAPDAPFAGETFHHRWALRSDVWSYALTVEEDDGVLKGSGGVAVLKPGEDRVVRCPVIAPTRGPLALRAVKITTTYPLGLFAKSRVFELPSSILIYPRRVPPSGVLDPQAEGRPGDSANPRQKDGTGELWGLRELAVGEDARQVHWLKSAAAGKLLRTEREREERRSVVFQLPEGVDPAALDGACEALAAQAHKLFRDGFEVGLESKTMRLRPAAGAAQQTRILRALALAGFEEPR